MITFLSEPYFNTVDTLQFYVILATMYCIRTEQCDNSVLEKDQNQGDQIGRIFVHRAIVYSGQFLGIYRNNPNFYIFIRYV
jgi:hypothetical protein